MDDLISRQAVKELAHNQMREKYCGIALKEQRDFYIKLADSIIDLLPSAQPEIIYCKDCKKQNKHYHESHYKDTVCPLTAWRGKAQGHEYDYQYCSYAERREVTT